MQYFLNKLLDNLTLISITKETHIPQHTCNTRVYIYVCVRAHITFIKVKENLSHVETLNCFVHKQVVVMWGGKVGNEPSSFSVMMKHSLKGLTHLLEVTTTFIISSV